MCIKTMLLCVYILITKGYAPVREVFSSPMDSATYGCSPYKLFIAIVLGTKLLGCEELFSSFSKDSSMVGRPDHG